MFTVENIKDCFDLLEDGLIVVDKNKVIQVYNRRAQDIFGLKEQSGPGHASGKIAKGDIVIMGDTCLGADDGDLTPQDLELIGISAGAVKAGDAIIAVGRYKSPQERPYYKTASGEELCTPLSLSCCINKKNNVTVSIDDFAKKISISIDGRSYDFCYQICICHMLIVDGISGAIKFYQARGYTARGEDARKILMGKNFVAKGLGSPVPRIIGRPLEKIHPDNMGTYYIDQVIRGRIKAVEQKEFPINGIWIRSSTFPLFDEQQKIVGGALVFRDINELKLFERQVQSRGFKYPAFDKIKGNSQEIFASINVAQRVSASKSTILLLGESGTGKGLFAKAIHDNSSRAGKPFVTVNIAAIPGNLLESELFGYEEGAFTGAKPGGEKGKLRLANGGTLFLDEIGEMDFYLQAKILHVLQDDCFFPIGSSKPAPIDVRFIAATNRNLEEEVKKGNFRQDLFYRLNVVSITLPPLRDRKKDIWELVDHIFPLIKKKVGRDDVALAPEVYEELILHDWPGNIRELENVLEWAINIAESSLITAEALPDYLRTRYKATIGVSAGTKSLGTLRESLLATEKEAILRALKMTHNQKTEAMKILGLGRTAFYQKIKEHHIELNKSVR